MRLAEYSILGLHPAQVSIVWLVSRLHMHQWRPTKQDSFGWEFIGVQWSVQVVAQTLGIATWSWANTMSATIFTAYHAWVEVLISQLTRKLLTWQSWTHHLCIYVSSLNCWWRGPSWVWTGIQARVKRGVTWLGWVINLLNSRVYLSWYVGWFWGVGGINMPTSCQAYSTCKGGY